jgi:cell division protein FtsB
VTVVVSSQREDVVELHQKEQAKKLKLVDAKSENFKHEYIEQRARGAYIATICQPETAFDL